MVMPKIGQTPSQESSGFFLDMVHFGTIGWSPRDSAMPYSKRSVQ